eukprot:1145816-Pelagomonas_calceolata.AAC.2
MTWPAGTWSGLKEGCSIKMNWAALSWSDSKESCSRKMNWAIPFCSAFNGRMICVQTEGAGEETSTSDHQHDAQTQEACL